MGTGKTYSTKYLLDSNNNTGAAGQVLSTTSTGINWVDSGTLSTGLWLSDGNDIYNSNSGNVGIGTTSPGATLELNSDTGNAAKLKIGRQNGATNYLELGTSGGSSVINAIGISGVNASLIFNRSTTTATTQSMIIDGDGNVGIGTTSPGTKLHIAETGTISPALFIDTARYGASIIGDGTSNSQYLLNLQSNGGSTDVMRVQSSGNVGIGTTSPSQKLDVNGAVNIDGTLFVNTTNNHIRLVDTDNTGNFSVGVNTNFQIRDINANTTPLTIRAGTPGNTIVTTSSGRVGIGLNSPGVTLHVDGFARLNGGLQMNATNATIYQILDSDLRFGTNNTERMRIDNTGYVGIGTTSPSEKLHVVGDQLIFGDLLLEGSANSFRTVSMNTVDGSDNQTLYLCGGQTASISRGGLVQIAGNEAATTGGSVLLKAGNVSTGDIDFYTANTQRMIINNGGNVGIGTTSPTADLHIQGSSETDVPILRVGGFGNSGSKLELAEALTSGNMTYGYSFFNDGNSSNTLIIKAHNNSTTGITAMTIDRGNALTTFGPVPVVGTRTAGDNTTRAASTAFVTSAISTASGNYLPLAGGTMTGNTLHGDDVKSMYGAGNDLQIYHNGSNSLIEQSGTGKLILDATSTGINIQSGSGETRFTKSGASSEIKVDDASQVNKVVLKASGNSYLNGGNVGIGTTSPVGRLEVVTTDANRYIRFKAPNGEERFQFYTGGTGNPAGQYMYDANGTTRNVQISAGGTSYFNGGNIGIGTTSPNSKLDVSDTSPIITINATATSAHGIEFKQNNTLDASIKQTPSSGEFTFNVGRNSSWGGDFRFITDTYDSYRIQKDLHRFYILGSEKMRITSAGNVGIGTTNPGDALVVKGGSPGNIDLVSFQNNAGNETHRFYTDSANDGVIETVTNAGVTANLIQSSGDSYFNGGNVGIGTTSPNHKLDIYSNENVPLRIHRPNNANLDSDGAWGIGFSTRGDAITSTTDTRSGIFSYYNGNLFLATNNTRIDQDPFDYARLTILSGGNVGIGTTSPGSKLEISSTSDALLELNGGTTANPYMLFAQNGTRRAYIQYVNGGLLSLASEYGDIRFMTGTGGAETEKMRITSTGNVGIGTTSPTSTLSVQGTTNNGINVIGVGTTATRVYAGLNSSNHGYLFTTGSSGQSPSLINSAGGDSYISGGNVGLGTTSPSYPFSLESGTTGLTSRIYNTNTDGQGLLIRAGATTSNTRALQVASSNDTKIMTVTSNGNVGIGTTSPGYRLEVDGGIGDGVKIKAGNAASKDSLLVSTNNDVSKFLVQGDGKVIINSSTGISGRTENFQVFGKQIITNTGTDGPVLYLGYNSSGSNTIQLGRGRTADGLSYMDFNGEVMSAGQFGFRIIRYSGQNASTELNHIGTGAFKLTCTNSADIILNPNSGSVGISQTNPSHKLDVTGDGRFTSTVTATNFILSSDERLKENVEKVCDNRVEADWKTFELKTDKGQKRYGVIAQELEKTNPEFVREDSQGFKSVAYIDLLIAKIAELEARLEKLEK